MSNDEFSAEQIEKGKEVSAYYKDLDEADPKNQPTDDETKTIPPIRSMMREDGEE